jgi:hypothetical protein
VSKRTLSIEINAGETECMACEHIGWGIPDAPVCNASTIFDGWPYTILSLNERRTDALRSPACLAAEVKP